jgi:hypothetical protein
MDWDRGIDEEEIRQLQEIEEGEVPRGWRPSQETVHAIQEGEPRQESCAEARESELKAKIHYHHIYPKFRGNEKYSSFFEELGINVDQWTVAVNEETHLKYIHNLDFGHFPNATTCSLICKNTTIYSISVVRKGYEKSRKLTIMRNWPKSR